MACDARPPLNDPPIDERTGRFSRAWVHFFIRLADCLNSTSSAGSGSSPVVIGGFGDEGADGDMGPPGVPGVAGSAGSIGPTGPQGPPGMVSSDEGEPSDLPWAYGPTGLTGAPGATGATGTQGPPGFAGDDGEDAWTMVPAINSTEATVSTTGNIDDLALGSMVSLLRMTNASDATIRGIGAGSPGQELTIVSVGAGHVFLAHQDTNSAASNRLINYATSANTPLAAGSGTATYRYDATSNRWRLVNHEQGAWITTPFSAGNFTASGSMTWTVDSGDVTTDRYRLSGRTLSYEHQTLTTTIGGTVSTLLQIAVPGGFSPVGSVLNASALLRNPTVLEACYALVTTAATVIKISKVAETVLALNTNGTQVFLSMEYDVS